MKKNGPRKQTTEKLINLLLSGQAEDIYKGKEVVVFDGQVYLLPEDRQESLQFFKNLVARKPEEKPTLVSIPNDNSYLLTYGTDLE